MILINAVLWVIGLYMAGCSVYLLLFSLAGRFNTKKVPPAVQPARLRRMAVLLPAYREDAVIIDSARAALQQTYSKSDYDIIVIADSLKPSTLYALTQLPIRVIEVSFTVSTKAKALAFALPLLSNDYEVAVVLDADNHMAPDCLYRLNELFEQGFRAVQGHRTAKNLDTSVAILDAVSEEINNHIFRKGHWALGLPAALIGSGMAFDFELLRELILHVQVINGFDREIELYLAHRGISVAYADQAHIFDEKVINEQVMERQRTRWLAAQWRVLRANFWSGIVEAVRGNWGYADKIFQQALLPRVLLLGLSPLLLLTGLLTDHYIFVEFIIIQFSLLSLALYIAIPITLKARIGWTELSRLPSVCFRFLRSLLTIRRARDRFIHTPHGSSTGSVS